MVVCTRKPRMDMVEHTQEPKLDMVLCTPGNRSRTWWWAPRKPKQGNCEFTVNLVYMEKLSLKEKEEEEKRGEDEEEMSVDP